MRIPEEFADPVVIPGPNLRSLHVDTESVDDADEALEAGTVPCGSCGGPVFELALTCPVCGVANL
jgi:hypothetical protein